MEHITKPIPVITPPERERQHTLTGPRPKRTMPGREEPRLMRTRTPVKIRVLKYYSRFHLIGVSKPHFRWTNRQAKSLILPQDNTSFWNYKGTHSVIMYCAHPYVVSNKSCMTFFLLWNMKDFEEYFGSEWKLELSSSKTSNKHH